MAENNNASALVPSRDSNYIFSIIVDCFTLFMETPMLRSVLTSSVLTLVAASSLLTAGEISVGASVIAKAGINASDTPDKTKTDYNINAMPDLGVSVLYVFSKSSNTGLMLDLGYDSYSYKMKYYEANSLFDNLKETHSITRFSIAPSIYLGGFQLGVAFGMPMGYQKLDINGNATKDDKSLLNTTTEVRIGALIPVYRGKTSSVNLNIRGGYMLTETFANAQQTVLPLTFHNSKIASLGLGLSYYFTVAD